VFAGHPRPETLVVHDAGPGPPPAPEVLDASRRPPVEPAEEFPHLVVEGEGVFEVPVGPIHAGIIEPGHFRFSTVGESVLNLEPRLFYTHRGLEKRIEGLPVEDAFFVAERICGVWLGLARARLLRGERADRRDRGTRRARVLRAVALELERLYNHVGDIATSPPARATTTAPPPAFA